MVSSDGQFFVSYDDFCRHIEYIDKINYTFRYYFLLQGEKMTDFKDRGTEMFVRPVCYHPTTVLSVDDDAAFSNILQLSVDDAFPLLCFNDPEKAKNFIKKEQLYYPFLSRCMKDNQFNILAMRRELYNKDRFKEIIISVTDYDMPHISGIELIKSMEFPVEISQHGHIILTGKASDEFKEQLKAIDSSRSYIGKNDSDYVSKLIEIVKNRSRTIFSWYSYPVARVLSRDIEERAFMFFDGNFNNVFDKYLKEYNICEFYIFDRQGSYVFLDKDANLSWLIIRNEVGVEQSIQRARQYGAPVSVIDALRSRKYILSLYEEEDFQCVKPTDWSPYLIEAHLFESDEQYLSFFDDLILEGEGSKPIYYYAFTNKFPNHGIDTSKVLSYHEYMNQ
jgi:CheY-like chemotaxis protein